MKRTQISTALRLSSYAALGAPVLAMAMAGASGSCGGVGCMASVLVVLAVLTGAAIVAAILNLAALLVRGGAASMLRSLELAAFCVPALLALLVAALVIIEGL